jgi:uncharacterized pyridoxamine 5'-phosphate oxidase family protein
MLGCAVWGEGQHMTITREALFQFLVARRHGVLATVSENGAPEAALVGIAVASDLRLVFDAIDTTRKCQNLKRNPRIAFVIGWDQEQTVQYEGIANFPEGSELEEVKRIYSAVWPEAPMRDIWPGHVYIQVKPKWIQYSSYQRLPWQIDEFNFPLRT